MTTTPHPGRAAVARLVAQARHARHWSQADLAEAAGLGAKTITNIETATHPPRPTSLARLERALGMQAGVLQDVLDHDDPTVVTLEQVLEPGAPTTTPASALDDAALIWELTQRLQTRTAELERLRAELEQSRTQPPADAYTLAADMDRSGHGRHLAAEADAAGEEDQT